MLSLFFSLALLSPATQPIRLARTFVPNEKLSYRVQGGMQVQERARGLNTWMPEDLTIKYDFSTVVKQLKTDGIAVLRYQRPTLTILEDTGQEAGPERRVERLGWDMLLTVSPLNRLIETKDQGSKKAQKLTAARLPFQPDIFDDFVGEIHRLALFAGGIDTSLDLAPPLPLREVAPGDTWKSTVSYQPQKVKGKDGKTTVQRLDYTYTYQGMVKSNGKMVQRVVGELSLDTDLAEFINDSSETTSEETGLAKFPLKLKTRIEFDLEPKTLKTLAARATSSGGFQLFVTRYPDDAVMEEKFSGGTTMSLLAVPPAKRK